MTVGQVPTLSIVRDIIVRRIDCSPIRVVFGIVVGELVLVGAVTCAAVGTTTDVSTSGLVTTNVGGQHERAGGEKALIRAVKGCFHCGRMQIITRKTSARIVGTHKS